jgi:hypothetical protein
MIHNTQSSVLDVDVCFYTKVFGVIIMIPSFPVKMEDQGSDAEEHMGETVCICGKVRTHLLTHLESAFKIFRRYLYHEGRS